MRKVISFATALVLFLTTIFVFHLYMEENLVVNSNRFGTWTRDPKFLSNEAIRKNLNEDTLVVFGSSEMQHGKDTKYHPETMFADQKFNTMLIGAGYYQSLSHAITLTSIEPDMTNRKVALVVAPQWFRGTGVVPAAFASRFSETNFVEMLKNKKLSKKTKSKIVARTKELLAEADKPMLERVEKYEKFYLKKTATWMDALYLKLYNGFLDEKARFSVVSLLRAEGMEYDTNKDAKDTPIDWDAYRADAVEEGKQNTRSNPFYVLDRYYEKNLLPQLEERKDSGLDSSYCTSPEYEDLNLFMDVCRDLKIEPLLINVPVNGWWYDYTGFPKEDREKYYQNIRDVAIAYHAGIADFSKDEYTEYFLEDTIHLGWKGWVDVNEALYEFNQKAG